MSIKIAIARRQIGTALALFIQDEDPVSIHCLACGGGELAYGLAQLNGRQGWLDVVVSCNPHSYLRDWLSIRNKYWNAMKHANSRGGVPRDDEDLLRTFRDEENDHLLFIAIYDFLNAGGLLPIDAHVFNFWMLARYPGIIGFESEMPIDVGEDMAEALAIQKQAHRMFPGIASQTRARAKTKLRRVIAKYKGDLSLTHRHRLMDYRKLILSREAHLSEEDVNLNDSFSPSHLLQ